MAFLIGFIIFIILMILSIIINIKSAKRFIDLLDDNGVNKLKNYDYELLKIKRKRRLIYLQGRSSSYPYREAALKIDFPVPLLAIADDVIEIYGIKDSSKHLIYKTEWSKDYAERLEKIVNEFNAEIRSY
jgi:hypothetical protein